MTRRVTFALALAAAFLWTAWTGMTPCLAGDFSDAEYQQLERREFQNEDGLKLQYRLYKPKTKKGKKYPLILFMHGAGEGGTDNDTQVRGLDLYLHLIFSETGKKNPSFLVAPQCPPNRGWAAKNLKDAFVNCAHDLVHALEKEFPIDKRRIYVTGVSMGGHGVYQWLLHFADETAAAIPVCGWIDTDQLCAVPAMKDKPVWIFHGDLDTAVNVQCGRSAYAALQKITPNVKYTEYPGVAHDSWNNAYREEELPKWLYKQKLGKPSKAAKGTKSSKSSKGKKHRR